MEKGHNPLCEIKMIFLSVIIIFFLFLLADYVMTKERVWYLESVVERHWECIESKRHAPKG